MPEVFVSYSWDTEEHENKVLQFTDYLRKKGFDAQLDKMLSQQETATNFVKMMHKAMLEHPKVIVVLSKGYKQKADTFTGGVGEEYQLLLNDINKSPKKYILVSFEGIQDDIIPFGLQGREIIDLSQSDGDEKLYRKLMDKDSYVFSPVASEKPQLSTQEISDFRPVESTPISIELPSVKIDNSSSQAGLYKEIEFKMVLNFKNISGKPINDFAYEIKLKQQLYPENYGEPAVEGYYVISESVSQKIFSNQIYKSKPYNIKIASHSKYQVLGTVISITVYTDSHTVVQEFEVNELFKAQSPQGYGGDLLALALDRFI